MTEIKQVLVPDIGDYKDVSIIEVMVKVGDTIKAEDNLVTLETDKAAMEVPSPYAGVIKEMKVKVGDKVSQGSLILLLECSGAASGPKAGKPAAQAAAAPAISAPAAPAVAAKPVAAPIVANTVQPSVPGGKAHASPAIRRFARELGVQVAQVKGSGEKGRVTKDDVQNYVKAALVQPRGGAGSNGLQVLAMPVVDFAKFGTIETKPLSRIKKISGANLLRNWAMIPAVTYHEDADITELEAFRLQINKENEKSADKSAAKLTMLAFLIKACVKAMQKYPEFNASIDGDNLVLKKYFNIGFAADTPNGLMVPVIKNADTKGVFELARESGELARQAREGKLKPGDMQGACFTISSVGGIGGTCFSPIVNAPEVAILGVSKSAMKPVWDGKAFAPRLILPLSLTADHRVIDGALATRFNAYLAQLLADLRRSML